MKNNILRKASPPYKTKLEGRRSLQEEQNLETRLLESPHPPPHDMDISRVTTGVWIKGYDRRPYVSYYLSISYASGDLFLSFRRGPTLHTRNLSPERLKEMIREVSTWLHPHMRQPYLVPQGRDLLYWRTYTDSSFYNYLPPQTLVHLGRPE
jgi:hypothetical protein